MGRASEFQISMGATLSEPQEIFCTLVASGTSYTDAAASAGFARNTGKVLIRHPAIKQRVETLIGEPDKARIAAKYWLAVIRTEEATSGMEAGSDTWRANMTLHLTALDKLARLHGWIVERKQTTQVTARLNVPREALEASIRQDLERLSPGSLKYIDAGVDESAIKAIAAGEAPQRVVVSPSSSRQKDSETR
jgi:hypothetical protein